MNVLRSLSTKILIATIFISILAGCSSVKDSASQQIDAINQIRKSLELPELPLEFVENTGMINSPSGDLEVANFRDSEGRIYSVNPKTNQVVEIDARAILSNISSDAPSLSPDEIKAKAMIYVKAIIPSFASLQSSLQYEEGGKVDNYFFTWRGKINSGSMNSPFLQIGLHKSGVLFAYYNTLTNYTVQEGDTCESIAVEHNVSVKSIVEVNNLVPECRIYIDQKLIIPIPTP
jgi:hypothetical protein